MRSEDSGFRVRRATFGLASGVRCSGSAIFCADLRPEYVREHPLSHQLLLAARSGRTAAAPFPNHERILVAFLAVIGCVGPLTQAG